MKTLHFAWRFLWARPSAAALNVLLLGLGLGSMAFLLLVGDQLNRAFERDLKGIDVVVGAKGSPMQLILSGVLHVDVPPGNVPLAAIKALEKNPVVDKLIPISLGDSLQGWRIVGTSVDYLAHYGATLEQGVVWNAPMQAVLGATVAQRLGLKVGDRLAGSHGLGAGGHAHAESAYQVVGILKPNGSVLDRLVLTDTASVWAVHETHAHATGTAHDSAAGNHPGDEPAGAGHVADAHADETHHSHAAPHPAARTANDSATVPVPDSKREITLALITYKTPMGAVSFPRFVNTTTDMQAAAPALEISRLLSMLGLGTDVLRAFAGVLLLTAGLSVFIALWSAVRERRADLALLRMLGAPPYRVALLLLCEALWLGLLAAVLGVLLGQGFTALLAVMLQLDHSLLIGGMAWPVALWVVPALALGVSLAAALLPALGAYRTSVLALLQSR